MLCQGKVPLCFSAKQILIQSGQGSFSRVKPKGLEEGSCRFMVWHSCF